MNGSQSLPPRRSALVLYGSETGNSQEVAEELGALAERLHFRTHVGEMNVYRPVSFHLSIVCYIGTLTHADEIMLCIGGVEIAYARYIRCRDDRTG